MRDLAVQGASDTLGTTERTAINTQVDSLQAEIDRIAAKTTFNGTPLLDGTFVGGGGDYSIGTPKRFQTGDTARDYISFSISSNFNSTSIGLANVSVGSSTMASNSLASVNAAIDIVTTQAQQIGSTVQRLRLIENNLSVAATNTTAAKGRILDADIAQEQANAMRLQIRQHLATAQLAQINLAPQSVLKLFR